MRFGDYLLNRNLATPEQISRALEFQRSSTRPLGKLARELGYINRKENVQVLLENIKSEKRYGDIAVEMGLLTRQQIDDLVEIQKRDSVMIGNILVEEEVLTKKQLLNALKNFIALNVQG
jgi:hypothetical protein